MRDNYNLPKVFAYFALSAVLVVALVGLVMAREYNPDWKGDALIKAHDGSFYRVGSDGKKSGAHGTGDAIDPAKLAETGEKLFTDKGCGGCHAINGKGGNAGPNLSKVGDNRDAEWLKKWIKNPPAVKPGTTMPAIPLKDDEIAALASYLAGLKSAGGAGSDSDQNQDRRPVSRGQKLYRENCSTCHGLIGEGRRSGAAPSLNSPDLMRAASDDFLKKVVGQGRSGTAMPAFGQENGGSLSPKQISDLVAFLRDWPAGLPNLQKEEPQAEPKAVSPPSKPRLDPSAVKHGGEIYASSCSSCHGSKGEGGTGPSLANQAFLKQADDEFIKVTISRGRSGTPMKGFGQALNDKDLEDLATFIRNWEK